MHGYERTDRVGSQIQRIVATELEKLDEIFDGVVITGVDVDRELSVAVVHYDVRWADAAPAGDVPDGGSDGGPDGRDVSDEIVSETVEEIVEEIAEGFEEHHHRFQRAVGAGTRLRRTPSLRFAQDRSGIEAQRIEQILAGLADTGDDPQPERPAAQGHGGTRPAQPRQSRSR